MPQDNGSVVSGHFITSLCSQAFGSSRCRTRFRGKVYTTRPNVIVRLYTRTLTIIMVVWVNGLLKAFLVLSFTRTPAIADNPRAA